MIVTAARWATIPLAIIWLGLVAECVRFARTHRPRPFDWERDCPELRDRQPHHVRVIDLTGRWK